MTTETFKWSSVVNYEETYIDGKSQGIRVMSKFTTDPKVPKFKKKKVVKAKKKVVESKAIVGEVEY